MDMRGFGKSSWSPSKDYSTDAKLDDMRAIIKAPALGSRAFQNDFESPIQIAPSVAPDAGIAVPSASLSDWSSDRTLASIDRRHARSSSTVRSTSSAIANSVAGDSSEVPRGPRLSEFRGAGSADGPIDMHDMVCKRHAPVEGDEAEAAADGVFAGVGLEGMGEEEVKPGEAAGERARCLVRRLDGLLRAREALAANVSRWLAASAPWLDLIGSDRIGATPAAMFALEPALSGPDKFAELLRADREKWARQTKAVNIRLD